MIYPINSTPELEIFKQEILTDKELFRAGSRYIDVPGGYTFTMAYQFNNGLKLQEVKIKVISINLNGNFVDKLPKGRAGELQLSFEAGGSRWLENEIKERKLFLGTRESLKSNIYVDNLIALESIKDNRQVAKLVTRLNLIEDEEHLLYIGKAVYSDIMIGEKFDLAWRFLNSTKIEKCQFRMTAIYSRFGQPVDMLIKGVPALIVIEKSGESDFLKMVNAESVKKAILMIGKEVHFTVL